MHFLSSVLAPACALLAVVSAGRSPQHVGKRLPSVERRSVPPPRAANGPPSISKPLRHRSDPTSKFKVDGTKIPNVNFDIGESYAGLLPVSKASKEPRQLYFWYFPTSNPAGQDDLTIWLNGGPGCSSLEGLLQENGPFLWQYGTYQPVANPYSWTNLTNMIWVEQPVGTGFSQGPANATSELDVAKQFLGFFENFIDTFNLTNKKIYIAGESYAGYYIPYIADAMYSSNDTAHFDLQATMMLDPTLSSDALAQNIPAVPYVTYYNNIFTLNTTFLSNITGRAETCGYTDYLNKYLTYPPPSSLPDPPSAANGCDIWDDIYTAVTQVNPCFDTFHIATTCPLLWDVLGFPGSFPYVPDGANLFFGRADVQKAINAPATAWIQCSNTPVFNEGRDLSPFSSIDVLPRVIDKSQRTVIGHGSLDFMLMANGSLLTIQNMTFGNPPLQGFQSAPADDFVVPYRSDTSDGTLAGSGVMGKTHTERNLTWVEISLSGHMVPQYAPTAAYRMMEYLLGRIDSLTSV